MYRHKMVTAGQVWPVTHNLPGLIKNRNSSDKSALLLHPPIKIATRWSGCLPPRILMVCAVNAQTCVNCYKKLNIGNDSYTYYTSVYLALTRRNVNICNRSDKSDLFGHPPIKIATRWGGCLPPPRILTVCAVNAQTCLNCYKYLQKYLAFCCYPHAMPVHQAMGLGRRVGRRGKRILLQAGHPCRADGSLRMYTCKTGNFSKTPLHSKLQKTRKTRCAQTVRVFLQE